MASPPAPIGCLTALNPESLGVILMLEGGLDMAHLTINLPENNSPDGVTLDTLEQYAKARGFRGVEECINRLIAGNLGFRPDAEDEGKTIVPGLAKLFKDIDNK